MGGTHASSLCERSARRHLAYRRFQALSHSRLPLPRKPADLVIVKHDFVLKASKVHFSRANALAAYKANNMLDITMVYLRPHDE